MHSPLAVGLATSTYGLTWVYMLAVVPLTSRVPFVAAVVHIDPIAACSCKASSCLHQLVKALANIFMVAFRPILFTRARKLERVA